MGPPQVWDQDHVSIPIIHKLQRQATQAVRGSRCIFDLFDTHLNPYLTRGLLPSFVTHAGTSATDPMKIRSSSDRCFLHFYSQKQFCHFVSVVGIVDVVVLFCFCFCFCFFFGGVWYIFFPSSFLPICLFCFVFLFCFILFYHFDMYIYNIIVISCQN